MKIPQQMHQFTDQHALIVVAGKQDALLYDAGNGTLTLMDSMKIPRPHFSDNEGHFKARSQNSGNGAIRSGSVREIKDQEIVSEFVRELKDRFSRLRTESYTDVYLTAPAKAKYAIVRAMPSGLKDKLRTIIEGNYSHSNPLSVVHTIAEASEK